LQSNRRNSDRYIPAEDRAWLGWWEGSVFRTTEAELQNISKGGVLVRTALQPPRRSNVWICLEGPRRTEWVEGKVLDVAREQDKSATVRIMFDEICPYAFFEVAVYGWSAARLPGKGRSLNEDAESLVQGLAMMII